MIDFRYHAMSLAAVFVALALGLLLGVTIGDTNLISKARGGLEASLKSDVNEARQQASDTQAEIDRQNDFISSAYPQLVGGTLSGSSVATLGSADVSQLTLKSVTRSVVPAGADVSYIAQLLAQPQYSKIAAALEIPEVVNSTDPTAKQTDQLGRAVGRRLARGRDRAVMRRLVFSRLSGNIGRVDLVAYARQEAGVNDDNLAKLFDGFERGIVAGLSQQTARVVGAETSQTKPSNIKWFNSLGLSTVDDVQDFAGFYALVQLFAGAKGDYGYKKTADAIIPQVSQ